MQHIGIIARRLAHIALMPAAFAAMPVAAQGGSADLRGAISTPEPRNGNVAALTKACDAWIGIACANLGLYFSQGPDEYRHPAVARIFIRNGCDAYVAKACFAYGVMHKIGIGGPESEKRAPSLAGHACEPGERKACMTLAQIASSSDVGSAAGFTPDRAREHACRLGERQACNRGES